MQRLLTLSVAAAVLPASEAVVVTPGSPCESSCGNVLGATAPDDLVCNQDAYAVGAGEVFQSCVECEMMSAYYHDGERDSQWALCTWQLSPGEFVYFTNHVFLPAIKTICGIRFRIACLANLKTTT
jgi:hypothetical protein